MSAADLPQSAWQPAAYGGALSHETGGQLAEETDEFQQLFNHAGVETLND